jgi:uncharacterized membrane protein YfcA
VAVVAAVLVGAVIQRSIGFGINLIVVPVLALAAPQALPTTAILVALPLSLAIIRHEGHAIDRPGLTWILIGSVPGTILGTIVVATVDTTALKVVVAISVLLAVFVSVLAPPLRLTPSTEFAGGFTSSVTGTAAGIGGPPLALLYQHHEGPTMRSTLAVSFLASTALAIASLAIAHHVTLGQIALAIALMPVVVLGSWIGRHTHGVLDRRWLRPAVLLFAAVAAIVVLIDALV